MSPVHVLLTGPVHVLLVQSSPCFTICQKSEAVENNKGDFCLIGGLFFFDEIYFRSGSREGVGKILKTISRQLKQRLQIVFASDLSEINVN